MSKKVRKESAVAGAVATVAAAAAAKTSNFSHPVRFAVGILDCMASFTEALGTTLGEVQVEFFWNRIPHTASNSNELAHRECYNDIGFHRVSFSSTDKPSYPHVKDSNSGRAEIGDSSDDSFQSFRNGATERRFGGDNIEDDNISRDSNAKWPVHDQYQRDQFAWVAVIQQRGEQ